ncbi:hypothetical protein J2T09_005268 [Neorhizobium huautlense]|uniref:Cellulose biosynthesis protein BcsF n=1 Tax=Neorhizobium huautlense TaxID=67774 RepID=A0ABT9Q187_9HYPH|nr:hypothetical protein [Neorhizobium huautlense]
MFDALTMFFLTALLVFLIGSIGIFIARRWRSSRTRVPQLPPEFTKQQWLNREAARDRPRR